MFGRFFKNKEDGKSGPPGHQRQGGINGATDELPVGGGFFNLPPPASKPYGVSNPIASNYPVPAAAIVYPPSVAFSAQEYGGAPSAPDMFGGMSVRAPTAAKPVGRYQPQIAAQNPYKGNESAPQSAMSPAPPGGSLFSGLAVASVPPVPISDDNTLLPSVPVSDDGGGVMIPIGGEQRPNLDGTGSESLYFSRHSRTSTGSSATSRSSAKAAAKKKKKKTFRPGFGRQLSDESAAALQRGDLKEDEVKSQQREGCRLSDRSDSFRSTQSASNPTDLAHLLPPVTSSSVLTGLTVHTSSRVSSGSVLAGLTVHKSASPAPSPPQRDASNDTESSGMLSGLNIHQVPIGTTKDKGKKNLPSVVVEASRDVNPQPTHSVATTPLTPEDRLFNTLRDFHESAVGFRQLTIKQHDEENRLLERKAHLTNQLSQYEMDLRDVEAQQHHACEVEDFEKADALNATINSVRHCITLTESDVRKVESELVAFGKAKEKSFANQLKSTRGTLRELEKFRKDQESDRTVARNEYKLYDLNQTQQLQFEAKRIETEMHHVSVSLENVNAEKSEIEATIEGQCSSEFAIQARLLAEKEAVEEDVRELERKLKEKLDRVQKIQLSIDHAQRDINTVRKRYSRQLQRIADREESIQKTKAEVEFDGRHLAQQRSEFEARLKRYTDDISVIGKRIGAVKKEMRAAALLANVLEVQETRREQLMLRKKQQTAELSSLYDAAAVAEQSLTMLNTQQEELQKSLSLHRNAIASAEAMIPRLEQEKKGAAAQRNFKEAARISKDIKALEKDRSTAEEMVEVVEMELEDFKERIDKRQVEYDEKKKELKEMEKHLELAALQELWKEAKQLRTALRKIEKCKSEGDAATDGIDFRSSAMLLVQAEYDACMLQVETLERKYDVCDSVKEESSEDDDDNESIDGDESDDRELSSASRSNLTGKATVIDASNAAGEVFETCSLSLEEITAQLAELEFQIDQATENEEYDLAARLDEKIETLKEHQQAIVASMAVIAVHTNGVVEDAAEEAHGHEISDKKDDEAGVGCAHEEMVSPVSIGRSQEEVMPTFETNQLPAGRLESQIVLASDDSDSAAFHHKELQSLQVEEKDIHSPFKTVTTGTVSSIFGGLDVKNKRSNPADEITSPELEQEVPTDTGCDVETREVRISRIAETLANVSTVEAGGEMLEIKPVAASAIAEVFSPTSSDMKDSFFGHVEVSTHHASLVAPSASGSLCGDMHISGTFDVSSSSNSSSEEVAQEDKTAIVDECPENVESSASKDMFGGLQLRSSAGAFEADVPTIEDPASMFGGLQLSRHVVDASTSEPIPQSDMFGGLELSSSAGAALPTIGATEASEDMFGGLQLSNCAVTAAWVESEVECHAQTEEETNELADKKRDTRMSIHELSEHESKSAVADVGTTKTVVGATGADTMLSDVESTEDTTLL